MNILRILLKLQIHQLPLSLLVILGFGVLEVSAETRGRIVEFAGYHWDVTVSDYLIYNRWSNSPENIWVDDRGRLHLKLRKDGATWFASQVKTRRSFGYGDYRFAVASNTERFDANINVGMFVYKNKKDGHHEIDIELTKFGNLRADAPSLYYSIQPADRRGNLENVRMNLNGGYTTHRFVWKKDSILFQSYHGHGNSIRTLPPKERLITEWEYRGSDVPKPGDEKLYINIFLWKRGEPPANDKEAEVVIRDMVVMPVRAEDKS